MSIKGKVEIVYGVVKLDGTNSFSLPADVLGSQNDYAIEFELKRAPDAAVDKNDIFIVSNTDTKNNTGLGLKYYPPAYNAADLYVNGYLTVASTSFLSDNFDKVTIVAKDKKLMLFRNGLIIVTTGEVKPSSIPLTFVRCRGRALSGSYL